MAELEVEEEVIETTDKVVENNEEIIETTDYEEEELTVDDYKKEKQRREKAEKALVELKKQIKTAPKSTEDVRAVLAEEKFYDKNPEAESYRKEVEWFFKKWLSREEWLILATRKDKEVERNREVYWKSLVWWKWVQELSAVSIDTFDKMTPQSQEEYTKSMTSKYGKIKFK